MEGGAHGGSEQAVQTTSIVGTLIPYQQALLTERNTLNCPVEIRTLYFVQHLVHS